jgi:hypothetical protein
VQVTIARPGVAVIGDPDAPSRLIEYERLEEVNQHIQHIQRASRDITLLSGAPACPACPALGALFCTLTLVYRRGTQPAARTAALCHYHARIEARRIACYNWPYSLLSEPLPARRTIYDLADPDELAVFRSDLGEWPSVLAQMTAGIPPAPSPEPATAGAVS